MIIANHAKQHTPKNVGQIYWAIGYYIVEYEQAGSDRAKYRTQLLKNLEREISQKGMNSTLFKLCRNFYLLYPQIGATVSNQFELADFEKKFDSVAPI